MLKYFRSSLISTFLGLPFCALIGWYYGGTTTAAIEAFFIATVLAILEISLSFDNAIVNAIVLKKMTPLWRHRFITWGMLIAVFGMRLVFPLAIVSVIAQISPWTALEMAATRPEEYARLMLSAHTDVSAFGGAFLLLVALKYFYNENKKNHWLAWLEVPAALAAKLEAIEMSITLSFLLLITHFLRPEIRLEYLIAGIFGIITYLIVGGFSELLEKHGAGNLAKAGFGLFMYLEVLDASFSFDGVVGAFAVSDNLFIIMIGLSIGAFFVRSLTIMFVEKETLSEFAYLEHGAFYAIGVLAVLMLLDPLLHTPEWVIGLGGAVFIVASFISSLRVGRKPVGSSHDAGV